MAPAVTEVDEDGAEVWRLTLGANQWSYRAFRVTGDPFAGRWDRP
jgi:hypothetical protein